ncbi:MAG: hypothetical protein IT231_08770 [Flavobacteriales bacterium]|jgi:hypothetical protein|nr:hypothetical protein [Flavobacteriales bacterium]
MGSSVLSIAKQAGMLKHMYPQCQVVTSPDHLRWTCSIQPHPHCATYEVLIEYDLGFVPKAYIDSPKLFCHADVKLPHCNDQESQWLCLSYNRAKDWTSSMFIAKTTVPWTSEWLVHYEIWCVTGTWEGGGVHIGVAPWEKQPA